MRAVSAVSCRWARGRLGLLAGADLPAGAATALRAHLVDCVKCRALLHPVLRAHRALVAGIPPDALPDGARTDVTVDRRFFAAMQRAVMVQVRSLPRPGTRTPVRLLTSAVAAAALFSLGVGMTTLPPRQGVNLLERPPIEIGRPAAEAEASALTMTVGHEAWQGLMGRRKALAELRLAVPVWRR